MSKNQSGIAHLALIGIASAVIIVLVGGGIYVVKANHKNTANSETNKSETSLVTPLPSDLLSVEKIKELAANESPGVGLAGVELEAEHGTYMYKVKLANGSTLFFNARSGEKMQQAQGKHEAENDTIPIPADFKPSISYDRAREIALAKKPGGTISKIGLESEDGKVVYSVRFSDDARVDVDANSGAIVRVKAGRETTTSPSSSPSTNSDSGGGSGNSGPGSTSGNESDDDDEDDASSHGGSGHGHDKSDDD